MKKVILLAMSVMFLSILQVLAASGAATCDRSGASVSARSSVMAASGASVSAHSSSWTVFGAATCDRSGASVSARSSAAAARSKPSGTVMSMPGAENSSSAHSSAASVGLLGAGATFPYPLYSKMFDVYNREFGVKVNYQAIGSGGGIRQIRAKTVDFGATDAFLSDEEMKKFPAPVVHIPTCAGAVVITYNLPGNPTLKLTPSVIADIFLGKIDRWSDSKLKALNPALNLPDMKIVVVHRSDGSGTTFIFSDYLAKVSREWRVKVGRGKSLNWPVGLGGKGNPGVAGLVKQVPGAVGYVELVYTLQNDMPVAEVRNRSGSFVAPSIETVSHAADIDMPGDLRVSLTDSPAKNGYPISGFTWLIVYKDLAKGGLSREKAEVLKELLWWITHQGQKYAAPLHYAPLSEDAVKKAEAILRSLNYEGKKL